MSKPTEPTSLNKIADQLQEIQAGCTTEQKLLKGILTLGSFLEELETQASSGSPEVLELLGQVYMLLKKLKQRDEERIKKQTPAVLRTNKRVSKQIQDFTKKNNCLEEENSDLKEHIELLRDEASRKKKKQESSSDSSQDEPPRDTTPSRSKSQSKRGPESQKTEKEDTPSKGSRKVTIKSESAKTREEKAKETEAIFDENTVLDIMTGLEVTITQPKWDNGDMNNTFTSDYKYSYQFIIEREDRDLLKFKDFAPKVFRQIRTFFGVTDQEFLKSFQSYENLRLLKGEGKSGAFFIFTKDKQFILKTATEEERDFLWNLLPYYWQYINRYPNTLLPRFYGVYSMKHEGIGGVTRFVIMNNIFNSPYEPVQKFDLKGSTLGRSVPIKKRQEGVILKDLDIKELEIQLHLPQTLKEQFVWQLKKDTEFLARHKVMDYSLLLGIWYETPTNKSKTKQNLERQKACPTRIKDITQNCFQKDWNGTCGTRPDGVKEIYYFGIIDTLIQFGAKKKAEGLFKKIAFSGEEASVVQPKYYSQRFFQFMCDLLPGTDVNQYASSSEEEAPRAGSAKSTTKM